MNNTKQDQFSELGQIERGAIVNYAFNCLTPEDHAQIEYQAESLVKIMHTKNPNCKMGKDSAIELLFCMGRFMARITEDEAIA
jgi:hypothetical protein